MKYIKKSNEPQEIVQWKRKFKNKKGRKPQYSDLRGKNKDILKESLLHEQNNLCGYCCCSIKNKKSHIEHIKPKGISKYANLSLEYSNLMASCCGSAHYSHCGHDKDNEYDENLFISPYEENCNEHFSYGYASGTVYGEDEKGRYMVDLLKLNADDLKTARRIAYWTSQIMVKGKESLDEYISQLESDCCDIPHCDMLVKAAKERLNDAFRRDDS